MEVKVERINTSDIEITAKLLTASFSDDRGVMALFNVNHPKYTAKVKKWFTATLELLMKNGQHVDGVYANGELAGIMIVANTKYKPSFRSMMKWTFSVLFSCGIGTVLKSASHDQKRKKTFTAQNQYVLEFIAIDQKFRGNGLSRSLFDVLQGYSDKKKSSVWLETTKEMNVKIFEKMNFNLVDEVTENSVKYFIMTNEQK